MASERRKLLMQNAKDPARWEALQIIGEGPQDFVRTELDTKGAETYQRQGGFSIVPSKEYNDELGRISAGIRAGRATSPAPAAEPTWEIPRNAAESVARLREQGGYEGMGPATMASVFEDEAAGAGRPMAPKPMPMDPDLERRIAAERARDAAGSARSAQGVVKSAPAPRVASVGRPTPAISVGTPGDTGALRAPVALRAPDAAQGEAPVGVAVTEKPRASARAGDEELAAAQQAERDHHLGMTISRASSGFTEAISGVGADQGAFDSLDKAGSGYVKDLLARREATKRALLEDPTSEQSRRLQAYVAKALPGVYSPEELQGITSADAEMVTRYGEMKQRLDQRAADRAAQQTQRADDFAREDRVREDEQGFRSGEAEKDRALQRELARQRAASAASTAAAQASLERDVQRAGEDLEGAGTLSGDLSYLDQMAAKDDIPGVGRWDSKKTGLLSVFASDDDTRTMQTMRSVVGRLLKERSGTAASDAEVERVMTELGMGPGATEQEFRVGLHRLRQDVGSALSTKQARYRPEVIRTYQERGGTTAQDVARRPTAPQANMVKMLDPQGRERMVPREKVQAAIAAGGRVVNG